MITDSRTGNAATNDPDGPTAADTPRRTTSIYLPVTMLDELDAIAARLERSRTWVVEKAVIEWLEAHRQEEEP